MIYRTGQTIEYANGQRAFVAAVPSEGTDCADGAFVIQTGEGFALCWLDLETEDEECWGFHDEAEPWRPTLADTLALYYAG